jgi:hypothetical protein
VRSVRATNPVAPRCAKPAKCLKNLPLEGEIYALRSGAHRPEGACEATSTASFANRAIATARAPALDRCLSCGLWRAGDWLLVVPDRAPTEGFYGSRGGLDIRVIHHNQEGADCRAAIARLESYIA